jgi:Fe-S cluster biogenesis protein NfuA
MIMVAPTLSNEALFERVTMIIDEKIRPLIERDGGKISFHHIENGIVFVQLSGACSTCAAANITLKSGVERILRKEIRDVKSVRMYEEA